MVLFGTGVCCARCHNYDLFTVMDRETGLDIFKVDPEYEQHEAEYKVRPAAHCKHLHSTLIQALLQRNLIVCLQTLCVMCCEST